MSKPIDWPLNDGLVNAALAEYGRPEAYFEEKFYWPPERHRRLREVKLKRELQRAWNIPFFKRLWDRAGFNPGMFRSLDDLNKIPIYTVDDIRESIEKNPPYGDYQGVIPGPGQTGLRMYASGGTTGKPRPTVYTAWDRVVGSLISSRAMFLHGFSPGDIILNSWSYSTHNGAWSFDENLFWWLGCLPITASIGKVTSSIQQLNLAKDYGAASILASADYLLHLKAVADREGFRREDFQLRYFHTIGDVQSVTEAWGAPAYEAYAFHEVQCIAAECLFRGGLHVFDDAFILEVVDPETSEVLPPGELGDLVVTCLYKTGSPQIRYNIKDLSRIHYGTCACGSESTRMESLAGRSDTMVKLRGINIWPEAVGSILKEAVGSHIEYFCVAYNDHNREEMLALVEKPRMVSDAELVDFGNKLESAIRDRLEVKINVKVFAEGTLDELTGKGNAAKLRRFQDEREKGGISPIIKKLVTS